jgi:tRNA(fMet)-specific endonuclease VapC
MNLLLDTNILIYLARDKKHRLLEEFINPAQKEINISIASVAEVRSIALRQKWGNHKMQTFDAIVSNSLVFDVSDWLVNTYVEIDTYSQCQNPNFSEYPFDTPRNMGKNDLWIASTASLLGLELVTTDGDFAHLHDVFLDVRQLNPVEMKGYF